MPQSDEPQPVQASEVPQSVSNVSSQSEGQASEPAPQLPSVSTQTCIISGDVVTLDEHLKIKQELEELKKQHYELLVQCAKKDAIQAEVQLKHPVFDEESLQNNDRFFTGLTKWDTLNTLYLFVLPYLSTNCSLSPFQQLLLTLIHLRLGSSGIELGYLFDVHQSTVSRIISNVIKMLFAHLKFLIVWPEREVLRKTLPMDFRKNCPKCVTIIDCFEIFIDRPSDKLARAQTYSSYKHHNTVKYLIAITPQGSISYISNGWGGRASDKHITENSNLLSYLLPGDVILADRGFDIKDSVGLYSATVTIPAFTKGKKQLDGIEVEQTRTIGNVR